MSPGLSSPEAPQSLSHQRGFSESDPGEEWALPGLLMHFGDLGMVTLARQGLSEAVEGVEGSVKKGKGSHHVFKFGED